MKDGHVLDAVSRHILNFSHGLTVESGFSTTTALTETAYCIRGLKQMIQVMDALPLPVGTIFTTGDVKIMDQLIQTLQMVIRFQRQRPLQQHSRRPKWDVVRK